MKDKFERSHFVEVGAITLSILANLELAALIPIPAKNETDA
ncbi:hypothetical protein [Nostoc sp. 106C]|nr:hypothetical protein [Nostoc sp. 106C]